jgi:hypothetical protein
VRSVHGHQTKERLAAKVQEKTFEQRRDEQEDGRMPALAVPRQQRETGVNTSH